jgi:hypothetical protein
MTARHARRDILTECIGGIDVKRGAAGELNRVFGLELMELLEERLPLKASSTRANISR